MANPRQRRKNRSGTSKVKHSRASVKNKHKVIVKGPAVLVANWDRKKTVRQNYRLLGLMPNLNPRQAGGIEPVEGVPFAIASATVGTLSDLDSDSGEESEEEGVPAASTSAPLAPKKLAKGEGRIERDENGKIVRVVFGGEDGEEVQQDVVERVRGEGESDEDSEEGDSSDEEMEVAKPWGEAMEEWDGEGSEEEELLSEEELGPRSVGQGIPIGVKRRKVVAKTDVVRELETLATRQTKVIRHTSALEGDWLISLVSKYGDDADKMARDRKVNVWQKTAGEIKRAVAKAGGFSKLKAKAIRLEAEATAAAAAEATEA